MRTGEVLLGQPDRMYRNTPCCFTLQKPELSVQSCEPFGLKSFTFYTLVPFCSFPSSGQGLPLLQQIWSKSKE